MQRTILITGASRGIGLATAKVFLENDWKVVGTSTSGKIKFEDSDLTARKLDITDESLIKDLAAWIKGEKIKLDVLVNNAGILIDWDDQVLDIAKLRKTLEVNIIGLATLTEVLLSQGVISSPGKIINLSSMSASITKQLGSYMPAYKISKIALNMYTRTLAKRLKSQKIDVYSIDPGWVDTEMGGEGAHRKPEEPAHEIFSLALSDKESGLFYKEGEIREW
jgi:NAD(P)-dependent dehydrogenase (short-subunit alcohol dehydrogenase family)